MWKKKKIKRSGPAGLESANSCTGSFFPLAELSTGGICPRMRNMPKNDKIMAFGPPNKIVLISWVDHPLQLPDQEREALEEYGIAWEAINWQLKELLGCKYHQVEEEMVRFYR